MRLRISKRGQKMLCGLLPMLAACFEPKPLDMQLTGVTPFVMSKRVSTQVALNGNFYVSTDVDFGSGSAPTVDNTFSATLGDVPLESVTYQDSATLQATVPANTLATGIYALTVTAPDGQASTLEHAVMVHN